MATDPLVSVVLPTFRRPDLVRRAVRDALSQTLAAIEVIVVVDGLDEETVRALEGTADPRLRVLVPPRNLGNAGARNHGLDAARGAWVAFLDDDDAWAPDKLARQVARARAARADGTPLPIVSCRFEARAPGRRYSWPRRFPRAGEPISEYLFTRRGPSVDGAIQTSTLLVPRALTEAVRFDEALGRYMDLDWLLRAARAPGVALVFEEGPPLSTYAMDEDRARISTEPDWRRDVAWLEARRALTTPRARAAYLLTQASIRARQAGEPALWPLLRLAAREGRFSGGELAFHVANSLLPPRLRRRLTGRRA